MSEAQLSTALRCWAEGDWETGTVVLSAAEQRHAENVRRVRSGDPVCLLNGKGVYGTGLYRAGGEVEVREVIRCDAASPDITLYMGALKQSAWEEVLKHATELGVNRIVRVETRHAVSKLEGKVEKKRSRWRELLVEACKQSGNPWLPELELCSSVEAALEASTCPEQHWVARLGGEVQSPGWVLDQWKGPSIGIWIGPEGDFSTEEYQCLESAGAVPLGLGPLVLRAETAALALISRIRLHG